MIQTVAIVVPAGNEEGLVGHCLDAIAAARHHAHHHVRRPLQIRTVVVLDRCVDATASAVSARTGVETITSDAGRVGSARALGVEHVLAGIDTLAEAWVANTDADSRVPADWITRMVHEADRGAQVVLGTVLPADGLSPFRRRLWGERHDLEDGHRHVHGANFGIRADTYRRLGGWPPLASGEDVALASRAEMAGTIKTVRTAGIPVVTSARLRGRAPHGFAAYLQSLVCETFLDPDEQPLGLDPA
jgi:cellulose synthase/poly-beta-1,6-N-acetylglucosamine synthase-like glycosyltransferase